MTAKGGCLHLILTLCHKAKDNAVASADDFNGEWKQVTDRNNFEVITQEEIRWHTGHASPIIARKTREITVMIDGQQKVAQLKTCSIGADMSRSSAQRRLEDRLEWDDGDVWVRKAAKEAFVKEARKKFMKTIKEVGGSMEVLNRSKPGSTILSPRGAQNNKDSKYRSSLAGLQDHPPRSIKVSVLQHGAKRKTCWLTLQEDLMWLTSEQGDSHQSLPRLAEAAVKLAGACVERCEPRLLLLSHLAWPGHQAMSLEFDSKQEVEEWLPDLQCAAGRFQAVPPESAPRAALQQGQRAYESMEHEGSQLQQDEVSPPGDVENVQVLQNCNSSSPWPVSSPQPADRPERRAAHPLVPRLQMSELSPRRLPMDGLSKASGQLSTCTPQDSNSKRDRSPVGSDVLEIIPQRSDSLPPVSQTVSFNVDEKLAIPALPAEGQGEDVCPASSCSRPELHMAIDNFLNNETGTRELRVVAALVKLRYDSESNASSKKSSPRSPRKALNEARAERK